MNLRRVTARVAALGVSAVLGGSALVGLTVGTADAATANNTYTCTTALGPVDAVLTVSGDLPTDSYWAGAPVPPSIVSVTAGVDPATAGLLATVLHATSLRIDDFALGMGTAAVPAPLSGALTGGNWAGAGSNQAFVTPDPGATPITMPSAMTVKALVGDVVAATLPCALKTGQTSAQVASINLLQQSSSTTAPAKVKGRYGKAASFPATVKSTSMGMPVTSGKVVAKEGRKVVGSGSLTSQGIAKIKLSKKLKKGKHKLSVVYAGTNSIKGSSTKTLLVVR